MKIKFRLTKFRLLLVVLAVFDVNRLYEATTLPHSAIMMSIWATMIVISITSLISDIRNPLKSS